MYSFFSLWIPQRKADYCPLCGLTTHGIEKVAKMLTVCRSEVTTSAVVSHSLPPSVHIHHHHHLFRDHIKILIPIIVIVI